MQTPPPPLAGTLYPNGRGRRGPSRLRGYDRSDPILPMPEQGKIGGTDINTKAWQFWSDPELWKNRKQLSKTLLACLLARKKKHTPRTKRGFLPPDHVDLRRWLRGDWSATEFRFFAWIGMIAQVRSNEVGLWNGYGVDYFSRQEIAERIDSHHRTDAKGRKRAWQVDNLVKAAVAAGLIVRVEQREFDEEKRRFKSKVAIFKVTNLYWEISGVLNQRDALLAREKEGRAAAPEERTPRTKAERVEAWRMRRLARELAGGSTPDYGPTGPPPPPERTRPKPP